MPQVLKPSNEEFDPEELDVEYDDTNFDTYDGEQPPSGTALLMTIKKLWWTYSSDETAMIKVLMEAEGNNSGKEEYEGLPVWDNLVFKPSAAFRYGPFLEVTGITLADIKKKMKVEDDDDKNGAPIVSIGTFKPDSDDAVVGIVTKRERWDGKWQVRAGKYLSPDDIEGMDDPPDDDDDDKPSRGTRGSRTKAPAKSTRTRSRAKPDPEPEEDEEGEEDETPTRGGRKAGRGSTATRSGAAKAKAKTARRGTRRAKDDDEPPF